MAEDASQARPLAQRLMIEVTGWPEIPLGVEIADGVNLDAEDPALLPDSHKRQCVSTKAAGGRCGGYPGTEELLCSIHSGKLDPASGAKERHRRAAERKEKAEERLLSRQLGTRALVADVLRREYILVEKTVCSLLAKAGNGDMRAAQALIPWLNQGLGMPTERVEEIKPQTLDDLEVASTEELERIVAEGRERRLHAVPDDEHRPGTSASSSPA